MARTVNAMVHAIRRDAFVDAGLRLMQAKGYEQTSVQDVLDELDASRGAFYHYFDAKGALLEAVVNRMVEVVLASLAPIVDDPHASAPTKLAGIFSGIASWKNERRDELLALMRVWFSDDNAIVREKFRRQVVRRLTPLVARVVAQGVGEEAFTASSPQHSANVFVSLVLAANETAAQLFLARQANEITLEDVERTLRAYGEGFERILGASPGSIPLVDAKTVRLWYG